MPNRQISEVIGNRACLSVAPATTVQAAAAIMKAGHCSAVLVVVEGKLVGICTERDIVFRAIAGGSAPASTPVRSIMTAKVQTVRADQPFGYALHLMYLGGFRHIPVVDHTGSPVGLLAAHDALDIDGLQLEEELVQQEEVTAIL